MSKPLTNSHYLLHESLGEGGMGIVYRATDRLTGETVALKQVTAPNNLHLSESVPSDQTDKTLYLALAREFQLLAGQKGRERTPDALLQRL